MGSKTVNRNLSLDFLRCLAIVLVLFRHLIISGNSIAEKSFSILKTGGWVGVDLFFVLSGFLVSGLIFKEYDTYGTFNPVNFLIRRGFKIYPTFYFFLAFTWGLTHYFHYSSRESDIRYFYEAIFVCNYTKAGPMHAWLWSICVEEHFYFLLTILVALLIRFRKVNFRSFLNIYLLFLISGIGLRLYNALTYPTLDFYRDMARSHFRFDGLFFGVLLSYMYKEEMLTRWKGTWPVLLALVGACLPFVFSMDTPNGWRFVSVVLLATNPLCYGYLMIRLIHVRKGWMEPFAYIGRYSYSIYLFHGYINTLCLRRFSGGWKYYAAYFLASLVIGVIISKLIEYPFLALRNRWFPGTGQAVKPAPVTAGS